MATEKKTPAKAAGTKAPVKAAPVKAASSNAQVDPRDALQKRGTVVGTVVSDKMQKTIVVKVDRQVRHTQYAKYVTKTRRFKAHDEKNAAKTGDRVMLVETRPMSREKRWALKEILRKAGSIIEANV